MSFPNARDCKHGQLARSCDICELEHERDELRAQLLLTALPQVQRDRDELLVENRQLAEQVKALETLIEAERERRRYWRLKMKKVPDMKPWTPASWAKFQYFADTWCVDCRHWQRCQKLRMVPGEPVSGWSVDECGWASCAEYEYERDREDDES